MRIEIELDNYPQLKKVFQEDKAFFGRWLKEFMTHADHALANNRNDNSIEYYNRTYPELIREVMNAFFNMEGLASKHHNEAEKQGLKSLRLDLHPLTIFTNNTPVYNAQGKDVSPNVSKEEFDLEDWLYSLFYGARFVSWQELAEYLSLDEYELVDVLKARNFEQLASIQEQLNEQEEKGIPKGKLIPGTGRLDLGADNQGS